MDVFKAEHARLTAIEESLLHRLHSLSDCSCEGRQVEMRGLALQAEKDLAHTRRCLEELVSRWLAESSNADIPRKLCENPFASSGPPSEIPRPSWFIPYDKSPATDTTDGVPPAACPTSTFGQPAAGEKRPRTEAP
jgi:hypothetical protein